MNPTCYFREVLIKPQTNEKRKLVPSILIGILNLRTLKLTWAWPAKINLQRLECFHSAPTEKNKQHPLSSEGDALLRLLDTTGTVGLFHFLPHSQSKYNQKCLLLWEHLCHRQTGTGACANSLNNHISPQNCCLALEDQAVLLHPISDFQMF